MERSLQDEFLAKLAECYGEWDRVGSRFGAAPFGKVAQDLSISPSQFSKLIYGTATEGMYQRSIENINRLVEKEALRKELEDARKELESSRESQAALSAQTEKQAAALKRGRIRATVNAVALILTVCASVYWGFRQSSPSETIEREAAHPLAHLFDREFGAEFDSPYLDLSEVQDYCPASAYEGVWSLDKPYKLPLPGLRKPGLYYLAKSADVRMKCSRFDTATVGKGRVLYGYEYLVNEIWLDTEHTPLSPTYFDKERMAFTEAFETLDFEADPRFRKVATIYSFFTDKFEVYADSIVRKGEPCGRYASQIDRQLVEEHEIDLKYILESVLGELTAAACSSTRNLFPDPNDLTEGESVLPFDCLYTIKTENLGIGGYPYRKGYRLEKQNYSDNLVCGR